MKKLLFTIALFYCNICFPQSFSGVKVYIANPYVERNDVIKTQMYNADYVRSHYSTIVYSMEENYVNRLFDSLQSFSLTKVDHDSIFLLIPSDWGTGTIDMVYEPCIVIDFFRGNRYNVNDDVWTFSVNREGYVCRTFRSEGNVLCYPNQRFLDFLKRQFPGMFFLRRFISVH